jgi:agmatinase
VGIGCGIVAGMVRYGGMYGPDVTFLGVDRCDLDDTSAFQSADAVVLGAPYDAGASYRAGARFGPQAIRTACYLSHNASRPHLALRVDPLTDLAVVDAGDVLMHGPDGQEPLDRLAAAVEAVATGGAVPVILGGDHTVTWPNVTGVARAVGWGRVSVLHFDAHADTGEFQFGSLIGHGLPMRRLIESGACRGDRFLQLGLRGYWPGPTVLDWMAQQRMRSYEMHEIGRRGLAACLDEAFEIATDGCDGVFLSVDIDVTDPGSAPGTGTPEPGGFTPRELLDTIRRIAITLPLVGMDVVEVSPPYDHADVTATLANRVVLEMLSGLAYRRAGGSWDTIPPTLLTGRAGQPDQPEQPAT